jgi:plastocyanin
MNRLLLMLLTVAAGALVVANTTAAGTATNQVAIVHVQKGCHVWSVGARKTPSLHLALHKGATLAVVNQDLDMHKLVQVSGPRINAGAFMMMNQRVVLRFTKAGVYRFHTRVADMRGMPEAKTIGPDNKLVLTVSVN